MRVFNHRNQMVGWCLFSQMPDLFLLQCLACIQDSVQQVSLFLLISSGLLGEGGDSDYIQLTHTTTFLHYPPHLAPSCGNRHDCKDASGALKIFSCQLSFTSSSENKIKLFGFTKQKQIQFLFAILSLSRPAVQGPAECEISRGGLGRAGRCCKSPASFTSHLRIPSLKRQEPHGFS